MSGGHGIIESATNGTFMKNINFRFLEGAVQMNIILTSSLGGSFKVNGKRIPSVFLTNNGLLDKLKALWVEDSKVMIICASPNDYEKNDSVCACLKEAFPMSGLSISYIEKCDDRNEKLIEKLSEMDVILLAGGHVPTQNMFMKKIGLKERLIDFNGLLIAWSAGSMNCASNVYAAPELEGEAVDTGFKRWISGLGLTETNIFPHYQSLKDDYLDGLRVMEDITYVDSYTHEILAMNDGSYITIENGTEILYGEAYRIKNGNLEMICRNGEVFVLKEG
ncbi:MAG: Type 1 glutamine amidotransferase-like domain-containing protein [Lachnospiraceae bacterium]|nr:Type 1 glutamine amidotransferase-like domain-containing protein [Lachnospiraceae bacterium]